MIRLAKKSDTQQIVALNEQFHLAIGEFVWDKPSWVVKEISKGNFFVIEKEGAILGAECLKSQARTLFIETIAVKKELHNQGIGRALIEHAKKKAKQLKKNTLTVESFFSYGLRGFYEKCGFKPDSPHVGHYNERPYYKFVMQV